MKRLKIKRGIIGVSLSVLEDTTIIGCGSNTLALEIDTDIYNNMVI